MKEESKTTPVTAQLPKEVYNELQLRIPLGERSNFIKEAILEKLGRTPRSDRLLTLEGQVLRLEEEVGIIKKTLAELQIYTYDKTKIDPYSFCRDETDRAIVEYLLQHDGATTEEISKSIGRNRWLVLNRLKKIQQVSERKLGKPLLTFLPLTRMGKRRAWWLNRELVP
ncbi:MAG: hypothetical protein ACE5PO_02325 [Candidatus Bathyarchaeia archaeon]